jgi:glycosyltransferase involved in cell wall biosynthesis
MPAGVPVVVSAALDIDRQGAAATRQRALEQAGTKWVAFLDDDDEMDPWHLFELWITARKF